MRKPISPTTPTWDLLNQDITELIARVAYLEAENEVLKNMDSVFYKRERDIGTEVRIFGHTLKEIAVILNRYEAIDRAMTDFKMP